MWPAGRWGESAYRGDSAQQVEHDHLEDFSLRLVDPDDAVAVVVEAGVGFHGEIGEPVVGHGFEAVPVISRDDAAGGVFFLPTGRQGFAAALVLGQSGGQAFVFALVVVEIAGDGIPLGVFPDGDLRPVFAILMAAVGVIFAFVACVFRAVVLISVFFGMALRFSATFLFVASAFRMRGAFIVAALATAFVGLGIGRRGDEEDGTKPQRGVFDE